MADQKVPSFDDMVSDAERAVQGAVGKPVQAWAQSRGYDVENLPANIVQLYQMYAHPSVIAPVAPITPQEQQSHELAQIEAPQEMAIASEKLNKQAEIDQAAEQHANALALDPMLGYKDVPKPQFAEGGDVPSFDDMPSDSAPPAQMPLMAAQHPQATPAVAMPDTAVPSFDDMQDDTEKYSTTGQQIKAGLEGVAKGVAGPLAPLIEKKIFNVKPEDILGREKANPITSGVGQGVGLIGGSLTGVGEAALMEGAGKAAAEAVGLGAPISFSAKVGSSAVQQAAEMAVLQSGDEVGKMILNDPETSAQSAIANIGLATALGGAGGAFITGAINPLWKATIGDRTEQFLSGLSAKLGGSGEDMVSTGLASKAQINIPPELAAKIDGNPTAERLFSELNQSDSKGAGRALQETRENFTNELAAKMAETIGHDTQYIEKLGDLDKFTEGKKIAGGVEGGIEAKLKPISDDYNRVNQELRASGVDEANQKMMSDQSATKALEDGWHKAEDDSKIRLFNRVMEKLPDQKTAEDLKKFISNLRESHPFGTPTYGAAKDLAAIIEDGRGRAVTQGILNSGGTAEATAAASEHYLGLKTRYRELMNQLDTLNEHLHVGKYHGPESFLYALKELSATKPERILNALSGKNNASVLELLKEISPSTLAMVRQSHVDNLLRAAVKGADELSPYAFTKEFNKLSPQIKNLVTGAEGQARIEALGELAERLVDKNHNYSNTARTIEKMAHGAVSPISMIASMFGHTGAGIAAHVGKIGYDEGSASVKLAIMKFLASGQPISGTGFKSMVSFMHNVVKGQSILTKAAGAVFKAGAQVLTDKQMPATADREKLDKIVTKFQDKPDLLMKDTGGQTGHYLPDHQMNLTQNTTAQVQYLANLKPQPYRTSPLDKPIEPTPAQTARYNRALDIANQPAIVMQHVKDGTIQPSDIQDIKALYPALYKQMAQEVTNNMVSNHAGDTPIPYRTRMGISLFLGQPIDGTMTPAAIQSAQPKPQPHQQQQNAPMKGRAGKGALNKMSNSYRTPGQAAESDRSNRD